MRYFLALASLGFFGWLGYTAAFGALPSASTITSLKWFLESVLPTVGHGLTGALIFSIGIAFAWLFLRRTETN